MSDAATSLDRFTWVPFYRELAEKLIPYRGRQGELSSFLESLRKQGMVITPFKDKDDKGKELLLKEIDPFTAFGVFNRGTTNDNRIKILEHCRVHFGIAKPVPRDFSGVPVLDNRNSWYINYSPNRESEDVPRLWRVFIAALERDPLSDSEFSAAFDDALKVHGVQRKLTMGLFWIRSDVFVSLDSRLRGFLGLHIPGPSIKFVTYRDLLEKLRHDHPEGFPQLSFDAWTAGQSVDYWMVGAWWESEKPQDQTDRFLKDGVWRNGFKDKLLDVVKSMKAGDRIAIKAATTQTKDLPFNNGGKPASKLIIKATGKILENPGDGQSVKVKWDSRIPDRDWFIYTGAGLQTIWRLPKEDESAKMLVRFVFDHEPQDYDFFLKKPPQPQVEYGIDTLLVEGGFLDRKAAEEILERLRLKKNILLQGAPGVGKTFLARKLAYCLMGSADDSRITSVQFHPSFSYEDFVQGYRPTGVAGHFELRPGPFLDLCARARQAEGQPHVLLIDEINRGNTSQILGELLLLLEADKRGEKHGVDPLYRNEAGEKLWVPENVYVIGTMNTADRSLAMVDYALRRRFATFKIPPCFGTAFRDWLEKKRLPEDLQELVVSRMSSLNDMISQDPQLGPGFQVGHSFFCPSDKDCSDYGMKWYATVVKTEIIPTLEEYWFDTPEKVAKALQILTV